MPVSVSSLTNSGVVIQVESEAGDQLAEELATRLQLPLISATSVWADGEIRLRYRDGALQASCLGPTGGQMAVCADYLKVSSDRRHRQAQGELLIKAVQGRHRRPLSVLDATAGLAADAMLISAMGHRVVALERSPFVFELIKDGLARAARGGVSEMPDIHCAEAITWLTDHLDSQFDVIYLDPMFANAGKRSLPQKNMQLLRILCAEPVDNAALLEAARARAALKVVVKRPAKGEWLGQKPDYSINGQRVRFDVYQCS